MAHYYELTSNGVEPRHYVGVSSRPGELRPTRITDARKKAWYPSVTTIQGLLDKPALTNWKIDEHLKQAYLYCAAHDRQYVFGSTLEEFIDSIKTQTQIALDKAPKDGTDFHDVLEHYFKWEIGSAVIDIPTEQLRICNAVDDLMRDKTGIYRTDWISEMSFVNELGFAGKVDISHDMRGVSWVIDFKTKNTADKWKPGKMAYSEMAMQLAAYRVGLGLPNARCANVFICLEDGAVEFHEWDNAELDKQFANFADLLRIWLRNAGYMPGSQQTGNS